MEIVMKNNRAKTWMRMKKDWRLYTFLLIPLIYVIVFKYIPMGGVVIAFKDYKMRLGIWGSEWVGLEYFKKIFSDQSKALKILMILWRP